MDTEGMVVVVMVMEVISWRMNGSDGRVNKLTASLREHVVRATRTGLNVTKDFDEARKLTDILGLDTIIRSIQLHLCLHRL
jgi:hypothetical protein